MLPVPADIHTAPTPGSPCWALAPGPPLVLLAVREGMGPLLLREWEEIAAERPWAGLPARLERAASEGSPVTVYCHALAALAGLVLVPAKEADTLRLWLAAANEPQPPIDLSI